MAATLEVWVDEENQIIVQRISGAMTMEEFDRVEAMTYECVQRLHNPQRILVLIDCRNMTPTSLPVRRRALQVFWDRKVTRLTMFGAKGMSRIVSIFLSLAAGRDRIRIFDDEDAARKWLLS